MSFRLELPNSFPQCLSASHPYPAFGLSISLQLTGDYMKAVRFWCVLTVAVLVWGSALARANTYSIEGNFGTFFNGPLNGGSFSGTFSIPILPVAAGSTFPFTDWNVSLFDSSNNVIVTLSSANIGSDAFADGRSSPGSGDLLTFLESDGTFLELQFNAPFSGTGPIIPASQHLGSYGSFAGIGGSAVDQASDVISGESKLVPIAGVPEPSSLWLLGAGLTLAFRFKTRLRRFM